MSDTPVNGTASSPIIREHSKGQSQPHTGGPSRDTASMISQPAEQEGDACDTATTWQKLRAFYEKNFGLFLVFVAQMFGSLMTMMTRLLETGFETKFHALQIIFVRMMATTIFGLLYMWYNKVPDYPLGARGVRGLLVIRGTAGFIGLFGLYYSMGFLNITDATVITFLVPTMTALLCFVVLREPYTVNEAIAGLIAFTGVLFIARPKFLFPTSASEVVDPNSLEQSKLLFMVDSPEGLVPPVPVTPTQRSLAVVCAVVGSFGAASAYTTIRVIGKRTHSLISVNYFAALATTASFLILMVHPEIGFVMPHSAAQWGLLIGIGIAGFLLQFLLTEGLQREKAGRATNLIYIQLVFALIIDRVVWGTSPSGWSLFGSALIIGAAVWVSFQKAKVPQPPPQRTSSPQVDEESSLLANAAQPPLRSQA